MLAQLRKPGIATSATTIPPTAVISAASIGASALNISKGRGGGGGVGVGVGAIAMGSGRTYTGNLGNPNV